VRCLLRDPNQGCPLATDELQATPQSALVFRRCIFEAIVVLSELLSRRINGGINPRYFRNGLHGTLGFTHCDPHDSSSLRTETSLVTPDVDGVYVLTVELANHNANSIASVSTPTASIGRADQ